MEYEADSANRNHNPLNTKKSETSGSGTESERWGKPRMVEQTAGQSGNEKSREKATNMPIKKTKGRTPRSVAQRRFLNPCRRMGLPPKEKGGASDGVNGYRK